MKPCLFSLRRFLRPCKRSLALLASILSLLPFGASAQVKSDDLDRFPNFDRRAESAAADNSAAAAARGQAEAALRAKVKDVNIARDRFTDGPALIGARDGFLTGPGGVGLAVSDQTLNRFSATDPLRVVKAFVDDNQVLFGHGADTVAAARVSRDYVTAHNGMRTIILEQHLDDIRVFEATLQAHLTRRGELIGVGSHFIANLEPAAQRGAPGRASRIAQPAIPARTAVAIAARAIGEELQDVDVTAVGPAVGAEARQAFTAPTLLGAEADYVWFPTDAQTLRLCWEIVCTGKSTSFMFRLLIDAETGDVQVRQSLTEHLSNASYRVFTSDSPSPFSPGHGTPSSVQPPIVSRVLVTTPGLNLTASPNGWIDDGVTETRGNNVDAHTDTNADNIADLPRPQAVGPDRVFDPALDLTQAPSTYRDAAVVNLFYWCNFMHDSLYALGFTEAAGNFQVNNFGRGGSGNDAVQADAQDGSGTNNANFSTGSDGTTGRMQMYIFPAAGPGRDGDFDAEVILHEYTHGLSNRLVGHGVGISALQPRGMGEGWSDFYSMSLLSEPADNVNGNYAAGGYTAYQLNGLTENYYYGIRRYPYSTALAKNPLTFKDIDPAQASPHTGIPRSTIPSSTANEVHNMGEVWCVTLWDARANLIAKYGAASGNQLMLQITTDAMKLSVANPTFLQARDAILQADLVDNAGANRAELWAAFAKRGMGFSAFAPTSSTTTGLVESFDLPDNMTVSPLAPFAATGNVGGPFTPSSQIYALSNTGTGSLSWTATKTQSWITLSATSGTLATGGNTTVSASLNATANALPVGSYSETISFNDLTSGQTQTRTIALTVNPPRISLFSLDSNPGWTTTGEWAFGHPVGGGSHGLPDPTNGATGTNVFGVNLSGDYAGVVGGAAYVTAGPFNLTGIANARLQFQRWLNTDYQPWVAATIEVSRNGSTWTKIWDNGVTGPTSSTAWTKVQHDMAAVADNQPTVFVRWGHQVLRSDAITYSGWNIDDVELLGQTGASGATITTQPVSQVATIGGNVTFSVVATGLPVPNYQWNFNGAPIAGATNSTLTLANVQFVNAGNYNVVVSNSIASVTSVTATLSGTALPPTILTQPTNASVVSGQSATFSVSASGSQALGYQWRRNGFPISGATNSVLTLANASRLDADYYDVIVAAGLTPATSQAARLTVAPTAYPTLVAPDPAWNVPLELSNGNGFAIAPLSDGRAYIAGTFTTIAGNAFTNIARVKADGTIDPTFVPPNIDSAIRAVAVQADGKVLIGGEFLHINGTSRLRLARLNADGSLDATFGAAANNTVFSLVAQTDGRILVGGSFTAFAGTARSSIVRLNADGTVDSTFLTQGVSGPVNAMVVQTDTRIVIGGGFTSYLDNSGVSTVRTRLARLNANGTLDTAFAPAPSSTVNTLALQGDGKIVVGGSFTSISGTTAPDLARINADGTVDAAFSLAGGTGLNGSVSAVAIQADGHILAGGSFTTFAGTTINRFARLNSDGSRDASFQTTGVNSTLTAVALQADGQILIGGNFTSQTSPSGSASRSRFARLSATGVLDAGYNFANIRMWGTVDATIPLAGGKLLVIGIFNSIHGSSVPLGIARFNSDGTLDTTFSAGSGANSNVNGAVVQPDGKIVITGSFTTYNGAVAAGIARLNADGSLDSSFNVGTGLSSGSTVALLSSGRVFVGGSFTTVNGVSRNRVAILNADGSLDSSFVPSGGANSTVLACAVQSDGKIVIGGLFTTYNSATATRIGRLNTNGTLDATFATGSGLNLDVNAVALQADGKVVIGGLFTAYNGTSRSGIVRVNSNGGIDASFVPGTIGSVYGTLVQEDGKVIIRGLFSAINGAAGSAFLGRLNPDGSRDVTFAAGGFTDSSARPSMLAMRDSGQLFMQSNGIPTFAASQPAALPVFITQPVSQVAFIGGPAVFSVATTSVLPVTYQWLFNGAPIPGATTSLLPLGPVQLVDAGNYQAVVTSELGSASSAVATLTVNKIPATVALSNLTQIYDGLPHAADVTTTPAGLSTVVTYDGSATVPTNVGSYIITAAVNDPVYTGSATGTLVIAKAFASIALDGLTPVYDGAPKIVGATSTPAGLPIVVTYDATPTPPSNAGSYSIVATIVDPNYSGTVNGTLTIAKAPAALVLGALTTVYDGTPKLVNTTTTPVGLPVILTYNGSSSPPTNAGSYLIAATIVDGNFVGTATDTLTITKAPASITLGSLNAIYDGSSKFATATTAPAGLGVTFSYNGSASSPTNAGDYAVVASINDLNYIGTGNGTLTIARATPIISFGSLNVIYDGAPKTVAVSTSPSGLAVVVSYAGSATAPTNVGTYLVQASVDTLNYLGSATATLTIAPAQAIVVIGNLIQSYDGTPHGASVTTAPAGLPFTVTYNGNSNEPTNPGSYDVVVTITDPNYAGTATATLVIDTTVVVRHAPAINGGLDGSIQITSPENVAFTGNAWISGDLLLPGTPAVQNNGTQTIAGVRDSIGAAAPSNYEVTLNGTAAVRYVVRRIDPVALPVVATPPLPEGTRDLLIATAHQVPDDWSGVRDIRIVGDAGDVVLPPGTFGELSVNGASSVVLGIMGATEASIYNFQQLAVPANTELKVVGPVIITIAQNVLIGGKAGSPANPKWLTLRVADGGLNLNGNARVFAQVIAPNGEVMVGAATLIGSVSADRLTINGGGLVEQARE